MIGWSSGTPFVNSTGYCAVSLPLGWTDDGLPSGCRSRWRRGAITSSSGSRPQVFDDAASAAAPGDVLRRTGNPTSGVGALRVRHRNSASAYPCKNLHKPTPRIPLAGGGSPPTIVVHGETDWEVRE